MPPKAVSKEVDESLFQIFANKLKENQDQQDSRHEAIAEALRNITDKLSTITIPPPQPPDPPLNQPAHPSSSRYIRQK
ncbi:hypothetical protein Lal_00035261 [Lupinus albus]|nr:hypothetical protein Lal_00035261 [Lupinus albus]